VFPPGNSNFREVIESILVRVKVLFEFLFLNAEQIGNSAVCSFVVIGGLKSEYRLELSEEGPRFIADEIYHSLTIDANYSIDYEIQVGEFIIWCHND